MAAVRHSPIAIRQWLVRLGHLCFDDFLLLGKWGPSPFSPELTSDWSLALNNTPHVLRHFLSSANLQSAICNLQSSVALEDIRAAQARLVAHFALDLLKAKAPPLYDSLPWHDWDFSIVTKRFRLWQTRFLLAGDGTTVTMCRCRKSAGVYVVEPDETIARYTERKAEIEKVRRFRLIGAGQSPKTGTVPRVLALRGTVPVFAGSSSGLKLSEIPLPDNSVDLAIIGSVPSLDTGDWKLVTRELQRVAANALLVENNPLCPPLAESTLTDAGFRPDSVEVTGLGARRCWWKTAGR